MKGVEKKKTRGGKRNKKGRTTRWRRRDEESEEEEEEEEKEEDEDRETFRRSGAIVALRVPNKLGDDEDVVLGFDSSTSTREWTTIYFGAASSRID